MADETGPPMRTLTVTAMADTLPEIQALAMVAQVFEGLQIGAQGVARVAAFFADRAQCEIELAEAERDGDDEA